MAFPKRYGLPTKRRIPSAVRLARAAGLVRAVPLPESLLFVRRWLRRAGPAPGKKLLIMINKLLLRVYSTYGLVVFGGVLVILSPLFWARQFGDKEWHRYGLLLNQCWSRAFFVLMGVPARCAGARAFGQRSVVRLHAQSFFVARHCPSGVHPQALRIYQQNIADQTAVVRLGHPYVSYPPLIAAVRAAVTWPCSRACRRLTKARVW